MATATALKLVGGPISDADGREKALATALAALDKQFGKGSVMLLGNQDRAAIDVVSTGSLAVDLALGVSAPSRENAALFAGLSAGSGTYGTQLSGLRNDGLITYPAGGTVALTDRGREIAIANAKAQDLEGLHTAWCARLPSTQARMLRVAIKHYPATISRELLADQANLLATTGTFGSNIAALKSLGLVSYPSTGHLKATKILFPEGLR